MILLNIDDVKSLLLSVKMIHGVEDLGIESLKHPFDTSSPRWKISSDIVKSKYWRNVVELTSFHVQDVIGIFYVKKGRIDVEANYIVSDKTLISPSSEHPDANTLYTHVIVNHLWACKTTLNVVKINKSPLRCGDNYIQIEEQKQV